jgi:hypothetical protein
MPFPEYCLKGIKAKDCISEEGEILAPLLYFDKDVTSGSWRQSVNWQDDDLAIDFTLAQKRSDETLLFKYGLVSLSRSDIDRIKGRPYVNGALSYDREPLPSNPYHGNLVLEDRVSKLRMKTIAAILVSAKERVFPQNQDPH